ncbi:MAG: Na+/H+ antiporter NhaA [Gammaproteobacteria bacterium]
MSSTDERSGLERQLDRLGKPFSNFVGAQTTASLVLLAATLGALLWANSNEASHYYSLLKTPFGVIFGHSYFAAVLKSWINDGLMALFLFLLGLEIKREFLAGDLVDPKLRRMVMLCALGGMLLPALLFALFNRTGPGLAGWGIPTATDTAFALGMLALLGRRVPPTLIIFIVGLAIIDDLGAILVLALFYTQHLSVIPLLAAMLVIALMALANYAGVRQPSLYVVGGLLTWYAMLNSGVHATLAGVAVAMTVPARPKSPPRHLLRQAKNAIQAVQTADKPIDVLGDKEQHDLIQDVKLFAEHASTPLRRWEHALQLPVALLVLPLFALVNAGIPVNRTALLQVVTHPVGIGILVGLLVGKCLGISGMCWAALRLGIGALPEGVRYAHVVGASLIAGMGFTMSTFMATRGFDAEPQLLEIAKTSILLASLAAAASGSFVLYWLGRDERAAAVNTPL